MNNIEIITQAVHKACPELFDHKWYKEIQPHHILRALGERFAMTGNGCILRESLVNHNQDSGFLYVVCKYDLTKTLQEQSEDVLQFLADNLPPPIAN